MKGVPERTFRFGEIYEEDPSVVPDVVGPDQVALEVDQQPVTKRRSSIASSTPSVDSTTEVQTDSQQPKKTVKEKANPTLGSELVSDDDFRITIYDQFKDKKLHELTSDTKLGELRSKPSNFDLGVIEVKVGDSMVAVGQIRTGALTQIPREQNQTPIGQLDQEQIKASLKSVAQDIVLSAYLFLNSERNEGDKIDPSLMKQLLKETHKLSLENPALGFKDLIKNERIEDIINNKFPSDPEKINQCKQDLVRFSALIQQHSAGKFSTAPGRVYKDRDGKIIDDNSLGIRSHRLLKFLDANDLEQINFGQEYSAAREVVNNPSQEVIHPKRSLANTQEELVAGLAESKTFESVIDLQGFGVNAEVVGVKANDTVVDRVQSVAGSDKLASVTTVVPESGSPISSARNIPRSTSILSSLSQPLGSEITTPRSPPGLTDSTRSSFSFDLGSSSRPVSATSTGSSSLGQFSLDSVSVASSLPDPSPSQILEKALDSARSLTLTERTSVNSSQNGLGSRPSSASSVSTSGLSGISSELGIAVSSLDFSPEDQLQSSLIQTTGPVTENSMTSERSETVASNQMGVMSVAPIDILNPTIVADLQAVIQPNGGTVKTSEHNGPNNSVAGNKTVPDLSAVGKQYTIGQISMGFVDGQMSAVERSAITAPRVASSLLNDPTIEAGSDLQFSGSGVLDHNVEPNSGFLTAARSAGADFSGFVIGKIVGVGGLEPNKNPTILPSGFESSVVGNSKPISAPREAPKLVDVEDAKFKTSNLGGVVSTDAQVISGSSSSFGRTLGSPKPFTPDLVESTDTKTDSLGSGVTPKALDNPKSGHSLGSGVIGSNRIAGPELLVDCKKIAVDDKQVGVTPDTIDGKLSSSFSAPMGRPSTSPRIGSGVTARPLSTTGAGGRENL